MVQATVTGPNGEAMSATTATRGSSATRCGVRRPANRYGARPGSAGRRSIASPTPGSETATTLRRRQRLMGSSPVATDQFGRGAGQGRDEPMVDRAHRLGCDLGEVG